MITASEESEFRFGSEGGGLLSLLHVVSVGNEDLTRLPAFGCADDTFLLQQVDEAGGARVADVQPTLEEW